MKYLGMLLCMHAHTETSYISKVRLSSGLKYILSDFIPLTKQIARPRERLRGRERTGHLPNSD